MERQSERPLIQHSTLNIQHSTLSLSPAPIHPRFSSFDYTPAARMFSRRLLVILVLHALPTVAQTVTPAQPPMTVESATQAALRQATAYQQALIDEQTAALDVTQARGALLPRVRSASTATFNKPLNPGTPDPSFIAANATR